MTFDSERIFCKYYQWIFREKVYNINKYRYDYCTQLYTILRLISALFKNFYKSSSTYLAFSFSFNQFNSILQILFALFKCLSQYLSLFICIYFYSTTTFSYCTYYPWICNHFIIQINAYRISNIICSNICKCFR